jgi:hypothetical protein
MSLPTIKDEIMLREADDGTFAINLDDGEMYQLNPTALRIFNFCKEGITIDDAVSRLAAECSEPGQEDVIREDVEQTIGLLRELGFIEE